MANTSKASDSNDTIENIINLLDKGEKTIEYSTRKDLVLVLGLTSSGKSTFSEFITKDGTLTSEEIKVVEEEEEEEVNSNDSEDYEDGTTGSTDVKKKFKIVDKKDKIGHSLVDSKTIFPDLFIDTENNTPFYDCPGFSDTREPEYEISETYFVKKIIDSAERIKLIFIIDVADLDSKINLALFLEHVAKMIKNIKKFKDSIALIATKVDTPSFVKRDIIKKLKQYKKEMIESPTKKEFHDENIDFIDILLQNNGANTIGILKQPNTTGKLSEMGRLKKNKSFLRELVFNKRTFTWIEENDFGYTLSSKSEKHVNNLIEKINDKMVLDVEKIGQEIKHYYRSQEEKLKDIKNLRKLMRLGYERFKATRDLKNDEPQELITHIHHNIDNLNITISETIFSDIEKHIMHTAFFKAISRDEVNKTHTSHLAEKLKDLVGYLSDSQKWYSFLIDFNESLSKYAVQKNVTKYLEKKRALKNSIVLDAEPSEQHKIIENIKIISDLDYGTAHSLDETKLKFLENILDVMLPEKPVNPSCTNDTLLVQGENVRLSDIFKKNCPQAKSIQIFALNKVFIDADIKRPGDKIQLSIIAPKWEVISERKIILDGKAGEPLKEDRAPSPPGEGTNGYDGEPGNPGGDTGSFLGIGSNFINGEDLSVSLKGGDGAPGQAGSDGTKGRDGELVEVPKHDVKFPDFEHNCRPYVPLKPPSDFLASEASGISPGMSVTETRYICKLDGRKCTEGGKGGKGGKGGEGGKANKEFMLTLEQGQTPNIKFDRADGKTGVDGQPGADKPEGRRGQFLQVECTERQVSSAISFFAKPPPTYSYNTKRETYVKRDHSNCESLVSQANHTNTEITDEPIKSDILKPVKLDIFQPITAINDYKSFLRKNLHNHARETYLREFLELLEKREDQEDLNTTLGFVNELQGLEDQFYELHTKLPLLPFYESLLRRVTKYIDRIGKSGQLNEADKKGLSYLYTATFSKIINIKSQNANKLILDLEKYLNTGMQEIRKLTELSKVALVDDLDKNYHDSIEKQINQAAAFAKTKIEPEIKNILRQVDADLQKLIDDAISQQNATKKEQHELIEKEDKMRKQLALKGALGILSIASKFLTFLGPVGSAANVAISGGVQIVEALVIDDTLGQVTEGKINKLPATVKSLLPSIKTELTNRQKSLKEQLDLAKKQLKGENPAAEESNPKSEIVKEIEEKITSLQSEVDQQTEEEMSEDSSLEKRQELQKFIKMKKKVLKAEKSDSNVKDVLKILDRTETVLSLAAMPFELFKKLGEDEKKIDAISDAIQKAGVKLKNLQEYEDNIYRAIIPKCRFLSDQMTNLKSNPKDRAALDISKWEIQSVLGDIRDQIQKLTKEFSPQENISHLMEKLKGSLSAMIDMYNLIQDYHDKQELAHYIANINSDTALHIEIPDEKLRLAVNRLKPIIQSNIVLDKFERSMNSFRQLIYPFANEYERNFTLPYAIQSDDYKTVISTTLDAMEHLKAEVDSNKWDIKGYEAAVFSGVHFQASRPGVDVPNPFYVWTYDENKRAISQLFKGEEITLKSDVTRGLMDHNAVKFKEVGIFFKLADQDLQDELYDKLKYFHISMMHLGNSQYRCNDRFHVITNQNVSIEYTVGRHQDSMNWQNNVVYGKLSQHDAMLSPYTMWNIRLIKKHGYNFDLLTKFLNEPMNLELEGVGQYTRPGAELDSVCNDNLNKYYKADDTISPSENVALPKEKSNPKIESQTMPPKIERKQRRRRSLNKREWKRDVDDKLFATNGAYSSMKSSFINNIFNAVGAGLVTLEYLNPVNKISQWFTKRDKSIDQDFNMFDNNVPSIMKFSNAQSSSTEMPEVSNMFINDESATIDNAIYSSSICNHGNLLLLDLIIRSKSGVKHEQGNFVISSNLGSEYAQSLAYREHVPQ